MDRKDCPTCTALERAYAEGKLDIYVDVGHEGPVFPSEVSRLEALGGDSDRELERCRDCGTLYRYRHHYEYDAYAPSYDEYHLSRVEDAVAAVVAPLFEPLAPDALDAALARALSSDSTEVRIIAALALQSAPDKGGDAALRAAAEGLAAVESEVTVVCYNALLAAFRGRGAGRARAVLAVLAGLGEDIYGVRTLRSFCQEERGDARELPRSALAQARTAEIPAHEARVKQPEVPMSDLKEPQVSMAPAPATIKRAWRFESSWSLEDMKKALDEFSSSPWEVGDSPRLGHYLGKFVPPDSIARIYPVKEGYVVQLESHRVDYPGLFEAAEWRLLNEILPHARAENVRTCDPLVHHDPDE